MHSEYDANRAQDPAWWLSLDEQERISLVLRHHSAVGVELPNSQIHAVTHVVVENQVLLGDETPVAAKLDRLMQDGLSRHDAIHAIGTALAPVLLDVVQGEIRSDPTTIYYNRLDELTARSWLAEYS